MFFQAIRHVVAVTWHDFGGIPPEFHGYGTIQVCGGIFSALFSGTKHLKMGPGSMVLFPNGWEGAPGTRVSVPSSRGAIRLMADLVQTDALVQSLFSAYSSPDSAGDVTQYVLQDPPSPLTWEDMRNAGKVLGKKILLVHESANPDREAFIRTLIEDAIRSLEKRK